MLEITAPINQSGVQILNIYDTVSDKNTLWAYTSYGLTRQGDDFHIYSDSGIVLKKFEFGDVSIPVVVDADALETFLIDLLTEIQSNNLALAGGDNADVLSLEATQQEVLTAAEAIQTAVESPTLPTNAAQEDTLNTLITAINDGVDINNYPAIQTVDGTVDIGTMPTVTITGIANPLPVSQSSQPLPTGANTEATQLLVSAGVGNPADSAAGTDTGTFSLLSFVKRLLAKFTTQLPAALTGSGNMKVALVETTVTQPVSGTLTVTGFANPMPVTDNGGSLTVDGTIAATQSGTWNVTNVSGTVSLPTGAATQATLALAAGYLQAIATSAATTTALIDISTTTPVLIGAAGTGRLVGFEILNKALGALDCYLKVFDKATAPTMGTDTPVATFYINSGGQAILIGSYVAPIKIMTLGIYVAITKNLADLDNTAPNTAVKCRFHYKQP